MSVPSTTWATCTPNGYGVPLDLTRAYNWYSQAARQGHEDAQFALALAYVNGDGDGVVGNAFTAFRCFSRLADVGYEPAYYHVAEAYMLGDGVSRDDNLAFRWLRAAVVTVDPRVFGSLSESYEHGLGVTQSDYSAYLWLLAGMRQGLI